MNAGSTEVLEGKEKSYGRHNFTKLRKAFSDYICVVIVLGRGLECVYVSWKIHAMHATPMGVVSELRKECPHNIRGVQLAQVMVLLSGTAEDDGDSCFVREGERGADLVGHGIELGDD